MRCWGLLRWVRWSAMSSTSHSSPLTASLPNAPAARLLAYLIKTPVRAGAWSPTRADSGFIPELTPMTLDKLHSRTFTP